MGLPRYLQGVCSQLVPPKKNDPHFACPQSIARQVGLPRYLQGVCSQLPPPPSASTPHAPSMVVMQEGNIAQGMPRKRWGKKSPIGAKMSPIWG